MEHSYEHYKLRNQDSDVLRRTYEFLSEKLAAGVPVFGFFGEYMDWLLPLCESRTSVVPELTDLEYDREVGELSFTLKDVCVPLEDFNMVQELADLFRTQFDVYESFEIHENELMSWGAGDYHHVVTDLVRLRKELSDKVASMIQQYGTKEGVLSLDLERLPFINGKEVTAVCMAEAEFTTGMEIVSHWRFSDGTSDPVYATNRSYVYSAVEQIDEIWNSLFRNHILESFGVFNDKIINCYNLLEKIVLCNGGEYSSETFRDKLMIKYDHYDLGWYFVSLAWKKTKEREGLFVQHYGVTDANEDDLGGPTQGVWDPLLSSDEIKRLDSEELMYLYGDSQLPQIDFIVKCLGGPDEALKILEEIYNDLNSEKKDKSREQYVKFTEAVKNSLSNGKESSKKR